MARRAGVARVVSNLAQEMRPLQVKAMQLVHKTVNSKKVLQSLHSWLPHIALLQPGDAMGGSLTV